MDQTCDLRLVRKAQGWEGRLDPSGDFEKRLIDQTMNVAFEPHKNGDRARKGCELKELEVACGIVHPMGLAVANSLLEVEVLRQMNCCSKDVVLDHARWRGMRLGGKPLREKGLLTN